MNKEKRKNEILSKLLTIKGMTTDKVWNAWLDQIIEYITEEK